MEKDGIKVGDRVKVLFPNERVEVGTVAEIKHNGWCDVDFGLGCMSHDITQDRIERLIPISEEDVIRQREEEFDAQAKEWFNNTMSKEDAIKEINPNDHKITIPLPEDAEWEAIGRGYASVLMEKQARIDRLERMIFILYENICKGVKSCVLDEDDMETQFLIEILEKVEQLKNK